jgi:hypothetical protein
MGNLDTWHGVATLFLLPVFITGLWRYRPDNLSLESVWRQNSTDCGSLCTWARALLGSCAVGLILAGLTIALFGMTTVFVPSDLRFIGLSVESLRKISPMLIPVISHDRAEFWRSTVLYRVSSFVYGSLRRTQPKSGRNCCGHGLRRICYCNRRSLCSWICRFFTFITSVCRFFDFYPC